jgi:hypothetical protein
MMRLATVTLAFGVGLALASAVSASSRSASLQIHHVMRGCHIWSLNGGPDRVIQTVDLARGGSMLITNNDLMVQELVKTSGPVVVQKLVRPMMGAMGMAMNMSMGGKAGRYAMAHMGAQLRVTFPTAGTYRFKLVDRGDYMKNIKTIGPDNKPTLTVTVD